MERLMQLKLEGMILIDSQNQLSEIGKIKPITREINLNADRKRFWLGELKSVEDKNCNESIPISINYFIPG